MLFNSLSFLIFFPIVVFLYFVIPPKVRYIWLLLASYCFYMGWNAKYALLLLFSTVVTYGAGLLLYKWREKPGQKKAVVAVGLVVNFGILFLFKYLDFVVDTIQSLGAKVGITIAEPSFSLLLPVGISFYIFQAVGYMVDIYREKLVPEKNFLKYALFVSYFPQLVAGPIERSTRLLPQLKNLDKIKVWNLDRMRDGALVMLYGYFLKMVIADRAALLVDTVFHANYYSQYVGFTAFVGAVLFSIQIYCDFAGYTYIAIGASKVMGVELMNNFNTPYLATSIKDFWDRWHISLTSWFRDYLYFPLGGSRRGTLLKYVNIMIVFSVSGLWHGAAWTFVVWGALHGVANVVVRVWRLLGRKMGRFWAWFITFNFINVTWVFFRATSFSSANKVLLGMVDFDGITSISIKETLDALGANALSVVALVCVLIFCVLAPNSVEVLQKYMTYEKRRKWWMSFVLAIVTFLLVLKMIILPYSEFIYFNF